jgi:ElaB/YqjD/DUF883 family membrane-anchored ribosome-binding protein
MSDAYKNAKAQVADSANDIMKDSKELLSGISGEFVEGFRDIVNEYPIYAVGIALGLGYLFGRSRSYRR